MSYRRRNVLKVLREERFELLREGGNHTVYARETVKVPVPRHRQITPMTARRLAEQMGISWQEFKARISIELVRE